MAKKTEAEKREWREKMKGYTAQVAALSDSEREKMAAQNPIVTCEGHAISAKNSIFLSLQSDIEFTVIGGFKQWQKAGRQVKAGNGAAGYIHVPARVKNKEGENELRFRMVPMWDVSQTREIEAEIVLVEN